MSTTHIDVSGQTFGRLMAIKYVGKMGTRYGHHFCKCVCGKDTIVSTASLRSGNTKSCGCLADETRQLGRTASVTHGMSKEPTFQSWRAMMHRCYNKKQNSYPRYGGRGICVCEFLRASPVNLKALIGPRPEGMTLDRKENKLNYSCGQCAECLGKNWPLNVRWITPSQQQRNMRSNHLVTIGGETKCITDWATQANVTTVCMIHRLKRGESGPTLLRPSRNSLFKN